VIVIVTLGAPPVRPRLRRGRPVAVSGPEANPLSLTRAIVVRPQPLGDRAESLAWLERVSGAHEEAAELVDGALRSLNRALHAQRTATQDPYLPELGQDSPIRVLIGFGTGDQLADGHWSEARELPPEQPHRRRVRPDDLRPQERITAVLGGRERIGPSEALLLRARADLDQGRHREAAIQLSAGLEALLAELPAGADTEQEADVATLADRRQAAAATAAAALRSDLDGEAVEDVAETLGICERVLRRRRLAP
jgi:hypothetical protein